MPCEWETKTNPKAPVKKRDCCGKIDFCNPELPSRNTARASQRRHLFVVEHVNLHLFLNSCMMRLGMSELQSAQDRNSTEIHSVLEPRTCGEPAHTKRGRQQEPLQNLCVSQNHCKALPKNSPGLTMEE